MTTSPTRRRFVKLAAGALAAGGIALPLDAFVIEPYWPRLRRLTLSFDASTSRFPPGSVPSGLRIAHLADLHRSAIVPDQYLARSVRRVNAEKPDLIAITGDFVTSAHSDWIDGLADVLAPLEAPLGVLAVLGNHDGGDWAGAHGGSPELAPMIDELRGAGIRVLTNERVTLTHGGVPFDVVGLGDLWAGYFDPAAAFARTGASIGETAAADRFCIALSHNPDTILQLQPHPVDLILAGHSHGGQVRIPGYGPPILPMELRLYDDGLFDLGDGQWAYVNRGLGMLRRVRFHCRPEIAVLEIA